MSGLLATKLRSPSLPAKHVERPHLRRKLDQGLELQRQVTLVSAPAGFGKTTCISEWVHRMRNQPVAWLSLESADDDPIRFFTYFLAALQTIDASLGKEIEAMLRSGQLPLGETLSTNLINRISGLDCNFLLVLDDFQVVQDPFILRVLEQLVSNFPDRLHLVLITREDPPLPLARLRANNRLTELRAKDLRFTHQDINHFLQDVIGLSLSQADIATLEAKTEGWIAGVQLAGLSIRERANPSTFIASLSGSHRFILSYLTEQVLDQQPEETRQFLLQTAILDKLNGDLCNTVTGRADSHTLLEQLLHANLFLIPLDDEGVWYRYHHLFADLLRELQNRLLKEKTSELNQRASHWYAQAGMPSEAIQYALSAKDYGAAVELLEEHAMGMIMQGYAKTVNSWVQALPDEWEARSPKTTLAFAWMHLLRGSSGQVARFLDRLARAESDEQTSHADRRALKAERLVIQSLLLNKANKMAESLALVEDALSLVPQGDSHVRSLAYFCQASAYQATGEYNLAVNAYQMAIQHSRSARNTVAEMLSISGLAGMAYEHGQLRLAFEIANPACAQVEQSGSLPPISTVIFGVVGQVYYQWFQTEPARRFYTRALQLSTLGGYSSGVTNCWVLLSRLSQLEGDREAAGQEIQRAADLLQIDTPDYVRQETIAQQVRVYLAEDKPAMAEMALQGEGFSFRDGFSTPVFSGDEKISYSLRLLHNSSLNFLVYQARAKADSSNLNPGIELADRLVRRALDDQHLPIALEALLLRAQMHVLSGHASASQADYIKALELGQTEGFVGVFIEQGQPVAQALANLTRQALPRNIRQDYLERLLGAFTESGILEKEQPATKASAGTLLALVEPLTDREQDVLQLIADGLKYKEIATKLFITQNTVRFHVKAIYAKLGVNNRTQAIKKARQLKIL